MLIRLIYISTAVGPQTTTMTSAILQSSQSWNGANDVTGVLCQGQGVFLQCIEGDRRTVTQLYSRIYADRRHTHVEMIHCESITARRYKDWSMAHVDLNDIDPLREVNWMDFDPYTENGIKMMARIDVVLATGKPISPLAS